MSLCGICGKNEEVKTIANVPLCTDCLLKLKAVRSGNEASKAFFSDRANYPNASPAALKLIDAVIKAPVKKTDTTTPVPDKKKSSVLAIITVIMGIIIIGEGIAIGVLINVINKQNSQMFPTSTRFHKQGETGIYERCLHHFLHGFRYYDSGR